MELARYRCFLLGLPEELLPDTPKEMVEVMMVYDQTLRKGFDDEDVRRTRPRATLAAYMPADESLGSKMFDRDRAQLLQDSSSCSASWPGMSEEGARDGREDRGPADWAHFRCVQPVPIGLRKGAYAIACQPARRGWAQADGPHAGSQAGDDAGRSYGHAEFTTDAATYRPVKLAQAAE